MQTPRRGHVATRGTNTAHTVEAIEALKSMGRQGRGTVVLDPEQMSEEKLRMLDAQGVRSVRVNGGGEVIRETAEKIKNVGWSLDLHLDLNTWLNVVPTLEDLHRSLGTTFVADHLFSATSMDRLDPILRLVDSGALYVKISGCERLAGSNIQTLAPLIRRILRAHHGERAMFGSDWPHVRMGPDGGLGEVDLGKQLQLIWDCCDGDEELWRGVMVSNAARLYARV